VISAAIFDLDDTLYPQSQWLDGAWKAVGGAAAGYGVDPDVLRPALVAAAACGSASGGIIDRALSVIGRPDVPVPPLVDAFRRHRAVRLSTFPGALEALSRLGESLPLGLVTDGHPGIQRGKLRSLGLSDRFDAVIFSDELGRDRRKPHPAPFRAVLRQLGVDAHTAVYIGDHPDKDIAGAASVGMPAIRVFTGEYAALPDRVPAQAQAADVVGAIACIGPLQLGR
jgi:putative hydrolase of the HAD superfamily